MASNNLKKPGKTDRAGKQDNDSKGVKNQGRPAMSLSALFIIKSASVEELLSKVVPAYQVSCETANDDRWQILDTFNQEIRAMGQLLLRCRNRLILLNSDNSIAMQQSCPEKWLFVNELSAGPVHNQLQAIDPLRACLPLADIHASWRQCQILDDQRKTVCRLNWFEFKSTQCHFGLAHLQEIRGYSKAYRAVSSALGEQTTKSDSGLERVLALAYNNQPTIAKKQDAVIDPHALAITVKTDLISYYLDQARHAEAGVIADWDTEFLHDYRVNLRKVRSVLSLFKGVFSSEETQALKIEFSEIMKTTNLLRDLDVYLLDKQDYMELVPITMREGLEKMFAGFAGDRKKQLNRVKRRFRSGDYKERMLLLQKKFPVGGGRKDLADGTENPIPAGTLAEAPIGEYASTLIYKRYRKIRKLAKAIDELTPDEEVHELRIEFKKLRYLIEFFASLYPEDKLKQLLKAMKFLQSSLGRFNDYSVQQDSLNSVIELQRNGQQEADMDMVRSIGALIAAIHNRQIESRQQITENLEGFISDDMAQRFESLFSTFSAEKSNAVSASTEGAL